MNPLVYDGVKIYCSSTSWEHILKNHGAIFINQDRFEKAITAPSHVRVSKENGDIRMHYYPTEQGYIKVIIKYVTNGSRFGNVMSAYTVRRLDNKEEYPICDYLAKEKARINRENKCV